MKGKEANKKTGKEVFSMDSLKRNPFSVPEDYFSSLSNKIKLKKNLTQAGTNCFQTPPNYQEELRASILARKFEEELKQLVPSTQLEVPEGYFESLKDRILKQTVNKSKEDASTQTKNKVIPIKRLLPYAVAASLLVFLSIFVTIRSQVSFQPKESQQVARIERLETADIIDYLALETESGDLQILSEQLLDRGSLHTEDFSDEELANYLEYSL